MPRICWNHAWFRWRLSVEICPSPAKLWMFQVWISSLTIRKQNNPVAGCEGEFPRETCDFELSLLKFRKRYRHFWTISPKSSKMAGFWRYTTCFLLYEVVTARQIVRFDPWLIIRSNAAAILLALNCSLPARQSWERYYWAIYRAYLMAAKSQKEFL